MLGSPPGEDFFFRATLLLLPRLSTQTSRVPSARVHSAREGVRHGTDVSFAGTRGDGGKRLGQEKELGSKN